MAKHARINNDLLAMALIGYEAEAAKIDATVAEIQAQLGLRGAKVATDGVVPAKRVMSALARKRIAAAQRKRWAAIKQAKSEPKRTLSAAARKRIGDGQRKRWAVVRKAAAKKSKPVAKAAPVQKAVTASA
jgi:hypothetical protein